MSLQNIREYSCGHQEILSPDSPRFGWCFRCGEGGVEYDRLKCAIPKCRNPATRVVRYTNGYVQHYCDGCRSLAECDEGRVKDRRRLYSNKDDST